MIRFFNWIRRVFTGWYNRFTGKEESLYQERMKICSSCKDKINIFGEETCSLCGCPLKSKNRVKDEKCLKGLW